jgi:mono/diheme cytochrome c family protein
MKSFALSFLTTTLIFFTLGCGGDASAPAADGNAPKPKSMLAGASDPMQDKGVGPITSVELGATVDQAMAGKGKEIYAKMCTACHKPLEKFIGPAPKGILERRSPEWVMNMILNPEVMIKENDAAKKLLIEFNMSPMANQNLTKEEARAVLEYFRTL